MMSQIQVSHDYNLWTCIFEFLYNYHTMMIVSKYFHTVYAHLKTLCDQRLNAFLGQWTPFYRTYVYMKNQKHIPMYPGQNFDVDFFNKPRIGDQCVFLDRKGRLKVGALVRLSKSGSARIYQYDTDSSKGANTVGQAQKKLVKRKSQKYLIIHFNYYKMFLETLFCNTC